MAVSRVRVTAATKVYWPRTCQVLDYTKDEIVTGELAQHLADTCPNLVEVLDEVLGAEPAAAGDGVPDGTAAEVLEWVGDDHDKAAQALEAEQAREKPRSTLVGALEKLTAKDPE
jgi:hypothetical protein